MMSKLKPQVQIIPLIVLVSILTTSINLMHCQHDNNDTRSDLLMPSTDDAWTLEVNSAGNESTNDANNNGPTNALPTRTPSDHQAPTTLRIVRLIAPQEPIESGSGNVTLDCVFKYDKKLDRRLTIKWYHNDDAMPVYQYIAELNARTFNPKYENHIDKFSYEPALMARARWSSLSNANDEDTSNQDQDSNQMLKSLAKYRQLRLVNLTHQMSGKFTCVVSSLENYDAKSTNLIVFVGAKKFEFYVQRVGNLYNVTCRAQGLYPRPQLTLYKVITAPAVNNNGARISANNPSSLFSGNGNGGHRPEPAYELDNWALRVNNLPPDTGITPGHNDNNERMPTNTNGENPDEGFDLISSSSASASIDNKQSNSNRIHAPHVSNGARKLTLKLSGQQLTVHEPSSRHRSIADTADTLDGEASSSSIIDYRPAARIIAADERPLTVTARSHSNSIGAADSQLGRRQIHSSSSIGSSTQFDDDHDESHHRNQRDHDHEDDRLFSVTASALIDESELSSQVATHFECQLTIDGTNYSQSRTLALQRGWHANQASSARNLSLHQSALSSYYLLIMLASGVLILSTVIMTVRRIRYTCKSVDTTA